MVKERKMKQTIKSNATTKFISILSSFLFISKTELEPLGSGRKATVYAVHITPWFSFGFTRTKK